MAMATALQTNVVPFPYLQLPHFLGREDSDRVLGWFETDAPWQLRVADFYEQYEFSLLACEVPEAGRCLVQSTYVSSMTAMLEESFDLDRSLELVDICAHKLSVGQTIKIHNDFIGDMETHRLLIQFNRGWSIANGGVLMLFSSDRPEDCCEAILPRHGDALAFEISPRSFHAVSTIRSGERFTLVYTFRAMD